METMKRLILICLILAAAVAQAQNPIHKDTIVGTDGVHKVSPAVGEGSEVDSSFWSDSRIPHSVLRRHRTGMGLTISGSVMTVLGTVLLIASPNNVQTRTGPGYAAVNFSGAAAFGLILDLAGLPMTIAGAVKLAKSRRQARQAVKGRVDKDFY